MKKCEWQVMTTRDGRQVPLFLLPECLGLTSAQSAATVAREVLGSGVLDGTIMDCEYRVYDLVTALPLQCDIV
jgi:hypothetical protein